MSDTQTPSIPWFGARKLARSLATEVRQLRQQLETTGAWSIVELEARRADLERQIDEQADQLARDKATAHAEVAEMQKQLQSARESIVVTEDSALLQEAGVCHCRHPLTDVVAYEQALEGVEEKIKAMTRKDGGAVLATTTWTVNGSAAEGRAMVRDFSKLMLRAFNVDA